MQSTVTWDEIMKKEAKGHNDFSLGEVQGVGGDYIATEKGTGSRRKYFIPKSLVRGYDGKVLWLNLSESQAESEFKRDKPPMMGEYDRYVTSSTTNTPDIVPKIQPVPKQTA